jgi:glycosyltransferase involved in cell wall biosynthesis
MRIAIIGIIRDPWGGSEELWADMAKTALKEGHTVLYSSFFAGKTHPKLQALIDMGLYTHFRKGYIKPGASKIKYLVERAKIFFSRRITNPYSFIFKGKPDLIIYNGTAHSILEQPQLSNLLLQTKVPFVCNIHLADQYHPALPAKEALLLRAIYQKAKHVFFVSDGNRKALERQLGFKMQHSTIIRNPVNMVDTTLVPFPKNDTTQMAMVGNLIALHKGQDLTLQVLSQKQWRDRDFILNIYGSGIDEQQLKDLTKDLQLENKVVFHGSVNDIRKMWATNEILLMPSRMEGMPLVVVEAMLCGRTVMATAVGGHKEWIDDDVNGFIAEEPNVKTIAEAMEKAWERKNEWEQLGKLAREKAITLYDAAAGNTYLQLLLQLNKTI